jgi:hypothetical protein
LESPNGVLTLEEQKSQIRNDYFTIVIFFNLLHLNYRSKSNIFTGKVLAMVNFGEYLKLFFTHEILPHLQ